MVEMKIVEIVSKCNAVFEDERICLRAEFDETSFLIKRTDVSGFSEVVEVPLASNCLVDCTINIWSMQLSNMVKNMIDDVITTILKTPKSTLYPEKKYRLIAMRYVEGPIAIKQYVTSLQASGNYVTFDFGSKENAEKWTDEELRNLSQWFPREAIDAMKEPVEDE